MIRVRDFGILVALLSGVGVAFGEPLLPRNLAAGKALPDSASPDRRFVFLEVFHDGSTQNSTVITPSDRSKYLAFVPIPTVWRTDQPYEGRTVIQWNRSSSLVAVHDSLAKHSKLHLFRVTDESADPLAS